MSKEINITSDEWIDVVFEGKNKAYGAYELRQESPYRHWIAFVLIAILVLFIVSASKLSSVLKQIEQNEKNMELIKISEKTHENPRNTYDALPLQFRTPSCVELKSAVKFSAPSNK